MNLHLVSLLPEDTVSSVGDHRHKNLCRGGSVRGVCVFKIKNKKSKQERI